MSLLQNMEMVIKRPFESKCALLSICAALEMMDPSWSTCKTVHFCQQCIQGDDTCLHVLSLMRHIYQMLIADASSAMYDMTRCHSGTAMASFLLSNRLGAGCMMSDCLKTKEHASEDVYALRQKVADTMTEMGTLDETLYDPQMTNVFTVVLLDTEPSRLPSSAAGENILALDEQRKKMGNFTHGFTLVITYDSTSHAPIFNMLQSRDFAFTLNDWINTGAFVVPDDQIEIESDEIKSGYHAAQKETRDFDVIQKVQGNMSRHPMNAAEFEQWLQTFEGMLRQAKDADHSYTSAVGDVYQKLFGAKLKLTEGAPMDCKLHIRSAVNTPRATRAATTLLGEIMDVGSTHPVQFTGTRFTEESNLQVN
jgi:hypothetical protein